MGRHKESKAEAFVKQINEFNGKSVETIAALLGITETTVMNYIRTYGGDGALSTFHEILDVNSTIWNINNPTLDNLSSPPIEEEYLPRGDLQIGRGTINLTRDTGVKTLCAMIKKGSDRSLAEEIDLIHEMENGQRIKGKKIA